MVYLSEKIVKGHTYYEIRRSVRKGDTVKHQLVAYIGRVDKAYAERILKDYRKLEKKIRKQK